MTILDELKKKYAYAGVVDKAANIAEAIAIANNKPELGAEPIATVLEAVNADAQSELPLATVPEAVNADAQSEQP